MGRVISRAVAGVVEQLELNGDVLVTTDRLAAVMDELGLHGDARRLAYELQRDGWLGRLRSRHVWEFLPGARGGAYGSGDRFIECRAQRAVDREWGGVLAMESAASVLGLAQRIPEREVVALPPDEPFPKALTGQWRYVRTQLPAAAITTVDGLPSWNLEGLLVGIAARPSAYKDVAGLGQWLAQVREVDVRRVVELLRSMGAATRQRTAYLLSLCGEAAPTSAVVDTYPPVGAVWLGPRTVGGHFDTRTQVNDTLLHTYADVGSSA